jgi:S1-C subfamily serine protease
VLTALKLDFNWEMKENSDHYPFFAQRIPTMMFHTGLHSDYHRPSDDTNRLNLLGIQQAAQFLFATTYELSTRLEPYSFRAEAFNEYPALKDSLERPLPHAQPRLGVIWKTKDASQPGLVVEDITHNSPAHRADLRVGDRLVRFANKPVLDPQEFRSDVLMARSPVVITLERQGAEKPIDLQLELAGSPTRIGISWREDAAEPGTVLLTQVVFGSPAHAAGLSNRDRIYSVGGQGFHTSSELHKLLTTLPSPMELLVERDGRIRTVSLALPSADNQPAL